MECECYQNNTTHIDDSNTNALNLQVNRFQWMDFTKISIHIYCFTIRAIVCHLCIRMKCNRNQFGCIHIIHCNAFSFISFVVHFSVWFSLWSVSSKFGCRPCLFLQASLVVCLFVILSSYSQLRITPLQIYIFDIFV